MTCGLSDVCVGKIEDFALVDQSASPDAQDGGMRSRHLEMSCLQSKAGSSLALPDVSRARQNSTSVGLSLLSFREKAKTFKYRAIAKLIAVFD